MRKRKILQLENATPAENGHHSIFSRLTQLKPTRLTIFIAVFLLCALISLSYVFLQPAIYQSYATLLTVARTAVDQASKEADIQHVAIQKQILLGSELLKETASRLRNENNPSGIELTPAEIRTMLDVRPVTDTNLVEMIAEGSTPALLPILINTWIDVYLDARAEEIAKSKGTTIEAIQDELTELAKRIEQKRLELEDFREHNDIVSTGREENEALARLKGLNDALNTASEAEVKAKARLDSVRKSIARGQTIVPMEDTRTLSALERRAQELREELEELDRQYTREYMALSPSLKVIPEKLAALEAEIERVRQGGQTIVVNEAEQEYVAAKQATRSIQEQLDLHRQKVSEFTARFSKHDALKSDLEGLEQLFRDTQERLVQIETQYTGKYPYVDVIERAFLPHRPIRPDYQWNALIAVLVSLSLGLVTVWIVEFLTRKEQEKLAIHLSGIHLHNKDELARNVLDALSPAQVDLPRTPLQALEQVKTKELSTQQITELFQAANIKEKQLLILLLSGLTLSEITALQNGDIDCKRNTLTVRGISPRTIPLHPVLATLHAKHGYCLTDPAGNNLGQEDLAALLTCLQVDAGLPVSDEISAETLRHTYILHLIRQGIRLAELERIVGYIAPAELSDYGSYSPVGAKHPIEAIDLFYPGLTT
jgi:succinoglycan biosynthesis transport protein ExoP